MTGKDIRSLEDNPEPLQLDPNKKGFQKEGYQQNLGCSDLKPGKPVPEAPPEPGCEPVVQCGKFAKQHPSKTLFGSRKPMSDEPRRPASPFDGPGGNGGTPFSGPG